MNRYIEGLIANIEGKWKDEVESWTKCSNGKSSICPDEWAEDLELLNCSNCWAGVAQNMDLRDDYYFKNKDLVDLLLAKSGIRLAAVLDEVLL